MIQMTVQQSVELFFVRTVLRLVALRLQMELIRRRQLEPKDGEFGPELEEIRDCGVVGVRGGDGGERGLAIDQIDLI